MEIVLLEDVKGLFSYQNPAISFFIAVISIIC